MSRYQKRLTISLPDQWMDRLTQLKQTAPPGITQSELLRRLLRAGLEAAQASQADLSCPEEKKTLL